MQSIKNERSDENAFAMASCDNNHLNPDNVKIEAHEVDLKDINVKDEFDSETVKRKLQSNDEIINRPVVLGSTEVAVKNHSAKEIVALPKKFHLDIKKLKAKVNKSLLSQSLDEKEALMHKNAELSTEVELLTDKNSLHMRSIENLKKKVKLLEHRAVSSVARLRGATLASKHLQNKIVDMQTHICVLSTKNSKLEAELESLQGKRKEIKPANERNKGEILTERSKHSLTDLKDTITSLMKRKDFIEGQLDSKTMELKKVQEKYGKTMNSLSQERRKAEALMKNANKARGKNSNLCMNPQKTRYRRRVIE